MIQQRLNIIPMMSENNACKQLLEAIIEENVGLKNKLIEILKNEHIDQQELLEKVEYFQTLLVKNDDIINFVRHEVEEQSQLLEKNGISNEEEARKVQKKLEFLYDAIKKIGESVSMLKSEFSSFGGLIV